MTDKTSTQITIPPAYYNVQSSKGKVAKICAVTSICVTIIIATAVSLGLYFTRDDFQRHQDFFLNMKNQQEELPVKISLNTEENLEYVKMPQLAGYNEIMILRDYNQGLVAMKDVTSGGNCLIGEFNGKPEDFKQIHKTLANNKNVGIKVEQEVTFPSLREPIHPEVLTFAAGKAIAKFCNGSSYWLITKELSRKKRNPPGIPATQVVVNPVPLSQNILNVNGQQPFDLNNFLQNLQTGNNVNRPPQIINPPIPVNPVPSTSPILTPVILNPANNNALNIAGGPATAGFFNSPLVAAFLNPSQVPAQIPMATNPATVVANPPTLVANPAPIPAITGLPNNMIPNIPQTTGVGQPIAQPATSTCGIKCVEAAGTAAFGQAKMYNFCQMECLPNQFIKSG